MALVWVELRGGRREKVEPVIADFLEAHKAGRRIVEHPAPTYQTRAMRAEAPSEIDTLRAALDARGIKYHGRAGAAKLRALLDADE